MKHRANLLWSWLVRLSTGWWPDFPWTMRWRGRLYGLAMPRCGRDFQVAGDVRLVGLEFLSAGHHVYLAPGVVILAATEVALEDEVMLAFRCVVSDGNHSAREGSYRFGPRRNAPVRIGRGSWIGANATVVAGADVGRGVLVGANSVVVGKLPDGCLAAGVPAQVMRRPDEPRVASTGPSSPELAAWVRREET